jgi:hypothetical protein
MAYCIDHRTCAFLTTQQYAFLTVHTIGSNPHALPQQVLMYHSAAVYYSRLLAATIFMHNSSSVRLMLTQQHYVGCSYCKRAQSRPLLTPVQCVEVSHYSAELEIAISSAYIVAAKL